VCFVDCREQDAGVDEVGGRRISPPSQFRIVHPSKTRRKEFVDTASENGGDPCDDIDRNVAMTGFDL